MLITEYAVLKLVRDRKTRQWTVLGQCNDIPAECRPHRIYPIVAMVDPQDGLVKRIPRGDAQGWIDPREEFGYFKINYYERIGPHSECTAVDTVTVELSRAPHQKYPPGTPPHEVRGWNPDDEPGPYR